MTHRNRVKSDMRQQWAIFRWAAVSVVAFGMGLAGAQVQADGEDLIKTHGYNFFGELSYPADYPHFDYVNPDAPKGGEISVAAAGTFDSMNPYARKGRAGAYSWMAYESLLGEVPTNPGRTPLPSDQIGEQYGLLAESLEYPKGREWVIFNMRPEARFSDGSPVTAEDVVFSHNLFLEQGLPSYSVAVKKRIVGAEVLGLHRVKFTFKDGISRRSLIDQVGGTPVFSKAWFERTGARLDESRLEQAIGSGPYVLDSYDINRRIVYTRNPEYWGANLPINVGRHNFDAIRVEYFADSDASFEAFKAGEYTFRAENSSKKWATAYDFPSLNDGYVAKKTLPDGTPPQASGMIFNLGRDKFKDQRVRRAISLAYNFEWTNESLQFGLFKQRSSFVQDTPLQAMGLPQGAELELLKSLGDLVPQEMLEEPVFTAHTSNPKRLNDRKNLRAGTKLLNEAGWNVGDDGLMRNASGETLDLEFLLSSASGSTLESVVETFTQNLAKMGVNASFEKVDPAQFTNRRREREYDMIFQNYEAFAEAGTGLMQMYGSGEAEFSVFNPAGLASPLVDALIQRSLDTTTRTDQDVALTALDRALRYERIMIPTWYNDSYWVAYFDMFEHPDTIPPYALGHLDFWWFNAEKAAAIKAAGVLR